MGKIPNSIDSMGESKYLKKEDMGPNGRVLTIKDIDQIDVSMENEPEELKWVMFFAEVTKGLVLNRTNREDIADILESRNPNDWLGKQVGFWNDPGVRFAGKKVGGIRVKRAEDIDETDDLPF